MFRWVKVYSTVSVLFLLNVHARAYAGDEDKKNVMSNMKSSSDATISLQAKMKQRKISSFMEKEIVSKSQFFYMKPGRYALLPNNKDENEYIINEKEIWIVNHKNRTVTVTNENELNFSQYLMGFGGSPDILESLFEVKVESKETQKKFSSYTMQLVPKKDSKFYHKLERINVYVRDDLWLPYKAELFESDGDSTIWEFSDFKVNGKIKEDIFKQEIPKGYQLKRYEKK